LEEVVLQEVASEEEAEEAGNFFSIDNVDWIIHNTHRISLTLCKASYKKYNEFRYFAFSLDRVRNRYLCKSPPLIRSFWNIIPIFRIFRFRSSVCITGLIFEGKVFPQNRKMLPKKFLDKSLLLCI
jgi:hypothetical protein